jgi:LmbE family N-acetylglucosaminyl deacetylase
MSDAAVPKLLVVVAHPDDETFGCGSVLLHAAAAGWETAVLCATRGEAGEAVDGTPQEQLGAVRERETRAAGELLGVRRVDFLDFGDSGLSGPTAPETLAGAPFEEVRDQVRAYIESYAPQVTVTLDGSDGHRDHERIGAATVAAVQASDVTVERVYLFAVSKSLMRRWVDHMAVHDPSWEQLRGDPPGTPDELITTRTDESAHLARREEAMRQHASQRSPFEGLPEDLRRAFLSSVELRRVQPPWSGGPIETEFLPSRG